MMMLLLFGEIGEGHDVFPAVSSVLQDVCAAVQVIGDLSLMEPMETKKRRFRLKVRVDGGHVEDGLQVEKPEYKFRVQVVNTIKKKTKKKKTCDRKEMLEARFGCSSGVVKLKKFGLHPEELEWVVEFAERCQVREMDLRGNHELTGNDLHGLVTRLPTLCRVQFDSNEMAESIEGVLAVHELRQQVLKGRDFDVLRSLNGRRLGDKGVEAVVQFLLSSNALEVLGVAKCSIGESGCKLLEQLMICNTSIHLLEVYANRPTNAWAFSFANVLLHNQTLTSLDLGSNGIDDKGAEAIARALCTEHCCKLQELHLDYNLITNIGAMEIKRGVIQHQVLYSLWLHGNPIEDHELLHDIMKQAESNRGHFLPEPSDAEIRKALFTRIQRAEEDKEKQHVPGTADDLARLCIDKYLTLCPNHAPYITGQTVLSGIIEEDQQDGSFAVVTLGVGTRFVDGSLLQFSNARNDRVKDSHAEVIAKHEFTRYLMYEFQKNRQNKRYHLYTSTAPCGAASHGHLDANGIYDKANKVWQMGERKSCTNKLMKWAHLFDSIIIGRRWSDRCLEIFPNARKTEDVFLEQHLQSRHQNLRGDSDTCIAWCVGEPEVEVYDGKTGLKMNGEMTRFSPFYRAKEFKLLSIKEL